MNHSACSPGSPTSVRCRRTDNAGPAWPSSAPSCAATSAATAASTLPSRTGRGCPARHVRCCPAVPRRALVRTSYVAPTRRVVIAPGERRPTSRNALGGRPDAHGLAQLDWCDPDRRFAFAALEPQLPPVRRCPEPQTVIRDGCEFAALVNRSWTRQLVVAWTRPASLGAELPRAAGDVSAYRTLSFRTVNVDKRNPVPRQPSRPRDPAARRPAPRSPRPPRGGGGERISSACLPRLAAGCDSSCSTTSGSPSGASAASTCAGWQPSSCASACADAEPDRSSWRTWPFQP